MAERTITAFTFSKTMHDRLARRLRGGQRALHDRPAQDRPLLYNGVATPVQYAMIQALTTPETEIARIREEYRKRRDLLVAGLNDVGLDCAPPRARSTHFRRRKNSQEQPYCRADSA